MKITALKRQKRVGRVNVFLDDQFWLGVSEETLIRLGLYVGQELDSDEASSISAEAGAGKLWDTALRFLSYRPRSEREVRDKLGGLDASEKEIDSILTRLRSLGLVDDQAFAETYLRDRDAVRPYGPDRLRQELRRKGVAGEMIESVLSERDGEGELEQARHLARRDPLWSRRGEREVQAKLYAKLRRRGFRSGVIREALQGED